MLFSLNYQSTHNQEADELRCPCNQLGQIIKILRQNSAIRVCIQYKPEVTTYDKLCQQISLLAQIPVSYTVETYTMADCKKLLSDGYPAFFHYPVVDWETFCGLRDLGVSDIWIDGPLGFQWTRLAKAKQEVKIRVSPTVSPNGIFARNINSFFVRPEDISALPIDIIDFQINDKDKEDALFTIYKRGTFLYDLNQLIEGNLPPVLNPLISSTFISQRKDCGQRCKIPGFICHYCQNYTNALEISKKLVRPL